MHDMTDISAQVKIKLLVRVTSLHDVHLYKAASLQI